MGKGASPAGTGPAPSGLSPSGSQGIRPLVPSAVKLTNNEREALRGLVGTNEQEMFRTFKGVGNNCDLPPHLIRRTVRALARKGLATYSKGLWTDDGTPAGAGYALNAAGRNLADALGLEPSYDW